MEQQEEKLRTPMAMVCEMIQEVSPEGLHQFIEDTVYFASRMMYETVVLGSNVLSEDDFRTMMEMITSELYPQQDSPPAPPPH